MTKEFSNLDPLTLLAIKHGADKWGEHQYTPIYHALFQSIRDRPVRLLEIGVGGYEVPVTGGASLRMWAEYFPHAKIVGLDISPKVLDLDPRIILVQGSQEDATVLHRLWAEHGPFDIVIDDGSHVASHVLTSFRALYPLMPAHGIYIVEDTQAAFWPGLYGGSGDARGTIYQQLHDTLIDMHRAEIEVAGEVPGDHAYGKLTASIQAFRNMIVFYRGPNSYPSNLKYTCDDPEIAAMLETIREHREESRPAGSFVTESVMLANGGRLRDAVDCLVQGRSQFPGSVELAGQLALLAERAGDMRLVRVCLEDILRLRPDDLVVRQWVAKKAEAGSIDREGGGLRP